MPLETRAAKAALRFFGRAKNEQANPVAGSIGFNVDEVDKKWLADGKALIECLFPGACQRLEALGGEYLAPPVKPRVLRTDGVVDGLQVHLVYLLQTRHIRISIKMTYKEGAGGGIVHCAYHCGPSQDTDAVYFRICTNSHQGLHFHLKGYEQYGDGKCEEGHIPPERADPPIDTDLMKFLSHVDSFVKTKALPLRVT